MTFSLGFASVREYSKKRKEFGRPCNFSSFFSNVLSIPPNPEEESEWRRPPLMEKSISCIPSVSEHEVNTIRYETESTGVNHTEGGWPRNIDPTQAEHTTGYRKKVEKDEKYVEAVVRLAAATDTVLEQNVALDIHELYFQDTPSSQRPNPIYDSDDEDDSNQSHTISLFHDRRSKNDSARSISSLSWFPDGCTRIAGSYCSLKFQGYSSHNHSSCDSYVWDLSNTNDPFYTLSPPSPAVSVEYNPKDVHMIAGGCYNGLVCIWDTRRSGNVVVTSGIESSHKEPIYSVKWLQSKSACEILTSSTDGYSLVWDVRKPSTPIDSIPLISKDDYNQIDGDVTDRHVDVMGHGAVSLCYDINGGPSKFLTGSEHGDVMIVNRKVKNPSDRCSLPFSGHLGPVLSIDRNKFFSRYFLTIGDWTAKLWIDDEHLRTPLYSTPYQKNRLLAGCWSPIKPGLFLTSRDDGVIDFWDLTLKHTTPTRSLPVLTSAICSLSIAHSGASMGKVTAAGSTDGRLALVQLGESMMTTSAAEKAFVGGLLEKEVKREKSLLTKQKDKADGNRKCVDVDFEELLQQTEDEYLKQLRNSG
ncbi:hypothetical protein P9112_009783 [Eukaryota sp. TZLM1-RC]